MARFKLTEDSKRHYREVLAATVVCLARPFGSNGAVLLEALALVQALLAISGCASIPRGMAAVDDVTIHGNDALSDSEIEEKLATASSAKFLGLFRGVVYDYEIFDQSVLQRDLERVERYYRARGYYEARARAGRVIHKSENHVEITIEVEEGRPVLVREARIDGTEGLSAKDAKALRNAMKRLVKTGAPFEEDPFRKAEDAMRRVLTDRGYAWAKIERRADVDLPGHYATLYFAARPGPKATFGSIAIEGLGELPEPPVRRAIDITKGEAYSTATLDTAQRAVLDLGTFSAVEITPDLTEPPPADGVVSLHVRLQQQKLKSVLLGGGLEIDPIRTELHFHVGWEHQNLFGGFRHFLVDFKPGFDLYPTRLPTFQKPTALLPEERFRLELRQPGFLEARTNGVTSHEFNAYPVLLTPRVDPKAPVIGYLEYKGALGLDRTIWKLFLAPSYDFQWDKPFSYKGPLDPELEGIAISYVDLLAHFDFRNDRIKPHKGVYLQNDIQFAGIGGDARDFRIQPEVRGYVPIGRKVTFAARTMVGFLFPMNYAKGANATSNHDIQLIYLRGFFSGGPSSNRGYPLRGVGPHGPVPFFNPGLQAQALAQSCDPNSSSYNAERDDIRCAVTLGGLSIWETSLELRFPIVGPINGSTFCDASDVAAQRLTLRLDHPHLSCGLGLRYDTPIGPVRLDVGYRIPGLQVPSGTDPRVEGDPGTVFGAPIAVAFGIGEAF